MKELATIFADAGCTDVVTIVQSGNVVFGATSSVAKKIANIVQAQVFERYGFHSVIVTRSAAEFHAAVAANPYLAAGVDPKELHVMFLAHQPAAAAVRTLDADRSAPDSFAVNGSEIYLRLPKGVADTKLTNAYFDAKLSTTSTGRNWNTILKLAELLESDA